jgi:hypothetical protein
MCIFCGGCCGGTGDGIIRALMPLLLVLALILPGEIKNRVKAWAEKRRNKCTCPQKK